jgi:large subunit ribosomal protein L29
LKAQELRQLEIDELKAKLQEVQRDYFKLRTRREVERVTDRSGAMKMRRTIARIKTEIRSRELSQAAQGSSKS